jgi:hypothetical protein
MNINRILFLVIFNVIILPFLKAQDRNTPENQVIDRVIAVVGNQIVIQSEIEVQTRNVIFSNNCFFKNC